MTRTLAVAHKETLHIVRDPRSLIAALGLPVVLLVMYGFAVDFDLHSLPFAVVDHDASPASRRLIDTCASTHGFRFIGLLPSETDAERLFEQRRALVVLVIPPGFQRHLKSGREAPLQLLLDGADGSTANIAQAYATNAVAAAGRALTQHELLVAGVPKHMLRAVIEVRTRVLYNPDLQSRLFLVPGLIGLILTMLAALLTSGVVVRERERGSFELLAASPVSARELVVGKLLPYFVLATADVVVTVAFGWVVFGVAPQGSLLLLFALALAYVAASLATGLLISCAAATQHTAMQLAIMATVVPTMTLSGFAFPVRNMPLPLQYLSQVLPATHFMVIVRGIILKGVGLTALWLPALKLVVIAAVLITLAIRRFRKTL